MSIHINQDESGKLERNFLLKNQQKLNLEFANILIHNIYLMFENQQMRYFMYKIIHKCV